MCSHVPIKRFLRVVTCLSAALIAISSHAGAAPASKPHPNGAPVKYTNEQMALWHYQEGMRLKLAGRIDDALAQWDEALRLKPGDKDALKEIRAVEDAVVKPKTPPVKAGLQVPDADLIKIKHVLLEFCKTESYTDLADILTERTATDLAHKLFFDEFAIIEMPNYFDPPLNADFEADLNTNGLLTRNLRTGETQTMKLQEIALDSNSAVTGRRLLALLGKWAARLRVKYVDLNLKRPYIVVVMPSQVDRLKYTAVSPECVDISGLDFTVPISLEARFEEGAWRIGAQDGYSIGYKILVRSRKQNMTNGALVPVAPATPNH